MEEDILNYSQTVMFRGTHVHFFYIYKNVRLTNFSTLTHKKLIFTIILVMRAIQRLYSISAAMKLFEKYHFLE